MIEPADPTVRQGSGFEFQTTASDGSFMLGDPPITAEFSGGEISESPLLAHAGDWAWLIDEGGSGEISFATPLTELVLWFTNELEAQVIAADPAPGDTPVQTVCGVSDQGLDNTEFFGTTIFTRGGFNDWGNSGLTPEYQFFNFGSGVYNAQFEFEEADDYEFKIADGGWSIEYGNPDVDFEVDTTVAMSGGAALGGANSSVVIAEPGCYNFEMTITDTSALPAPAADLLLTFVEIDAPDALATSLVRVFDENGAEIMVFEGLEEYQRIEIIRDASQSKIRRVVIESLPGSEGTTGIGVTAVDDFRFGAISDDVPRALSVFYSKPDGDYSNTLIEVTTIDGTTTYTCQPSPDNAFGCVINFDALGGFDVTYTVLNDGVPDPGGPITFNPNDALGNDVYTFAGSNVPVLGELPALPANEDEVILYYLRPDGDYAGFGLHLFPQESPAWTVFTDGEYPFAGIDDQFGAYFIIGLPGSDRLTAPYSADPDPLDAFPESLGFVIHRGDEKDPGPDQFVNIAEDGNIIFVTSGVVPVAVTPPIPGAVNVVGVAAHWVAPDTLLWNAGSEVASVRLVHSATAAITVAGTELVGADGAFDLVAGSNPFPDAAGNQAHLAGLAAWMLPAEAADTAADLVRDQLIVLGLNEDGERIAATAVQIPLVLDELYADSATNLDLGVSYVGATPTLRVWAPTANSVAVNLYDDPASDAPSDTQSLTFDTNNGAWSITGTSSWDRKFYSYSINVFAPSTAEVVDNVVTDPYSVSLSTGSASGRIAKSQIVNLDDADLAPPGWDALAKPTLEAPEDIVLYELHVRDFSILDPTVDPAERGKYAAFAGTGAGVDHLTALAGAGLSHVHILPSFDITTVNEDVTQRVEITDPVEALCAVNPAAASLCDDFPGMTIADVMTAQPGDGALQQQIVEWIRDYDGFNWGYDPFHYGVPEGSYASNPEGTARIVEFRSMVMGLSDLGLRTVMDVAYNHTNAAGNVSEKSVLDRVVPGYYHRQNEFTGVILQDSCCPDTASEHAMMEKLLVDTSLRWVRDYKVDGFRFDIMGFHSRSTMEKVRNALQSLSPATDGVDGPSIYVYGEGWNFGDPQDDRRFVQATQANLAGTGIGSFNDRMRDAVRGGGPFDSGLDHVRAQGYINGRYYDPNAENTGSTAELNNLNYLGDLIRLSMAGNLRTYEFEDSTGMMVRGDQLNYVGQNAGYTDDPQEIINYAASHDAETLWDISVFKHPADTPASVRVRAQNVAQSILLLGQGIPFMHAGQDMLRSKSMDRNSFDSGDWFNRLDFGYTDNNFAVGEPRNSENQASLAQIRDALAIAEADAGTANIAAAVAHTHEMLEIRRASRLFRLRSAAQIRERVSYHNTGPDQLPGVIVQAITDGEKCTGSDLDVAYSKIVSVINPSITDHTVALFTDETFELHPVLVGSADSIVQGATHGAAGFTVPARTAAVFVQPETQVDCGALGVDVYLRGSFNDFGATPASLFDLRSTSTAEVTVALGSELHFFKVADDAFGVANCGAAVSGASVTLNQPFALSCSANSQNIQLDLGNEPADDYVFTLDATDPDNPTITVVSASFDTIAPTITITEPAAATVTAGSVVIRATATDNFAVAATRFFVDGLLIGSDTTPEGEEYSVTWNSTTVADGDHVLTAEAEDDSGNVGTSAAVTITIDSSLLGDNTPPDVTLDPVATTLTGTVSLSAAATDPPGGTEPPTGVAEVRFFYDLDDGMADPILVDSTSTEPYTVSWDTTTIANGAYLVTAEAIDGAGNIGVSAAQTTSIDNPGTYNADIFVCGIIADCATPPAPDAQLEFAGNDTFVGTLGLVGASVYDFRIVDSDGATIGALVDCGSESLFTPVVPDAAFALSCASGANDARLDLSREGDGDYVFTLDATNQTSPLLTISSAEPPPIGAPNDTTPPSVAVTGLQPGGTPLSGAQVIVASASDAESPLARVEFEVDGELVWSDTTAPYEAPWDSETVANGDHAVTATAVDAAGNQATSAGFGITVDNIGPYGVGMYPRGSWDPNFALLDEQMPMGYLGGGVYTETLMGDLRAANPDTEITGNLRFKIAADDFDISNANCNPPVDNTPTILNIPLDFVCSATAGNARFDVSLEEDADYVFTFDASRSLTNPVVTVSRADPGPDPVPDDTSAPTFLAPLTIDPPDDPVTFGVDITASVTDDNVVASVAFLVDNVPIWTDFTEPFQAPWDSTLVENGLRTITALATDANGNVGLSAPLTVNVDNPDFGPFGVPMFVRGAFVDDSMLQFGTENQLVLIGNGVYEAVVNIDRTDEAPTEFFIGFKVADAGWTDGTNCGVPAASTVALGDTTEMVCAAADNDNNNSVNITLNLLGELQPADYLFTINAADFPATRPTVTVTGPQ